MDQKILCCYGSQFSPIVISLQMPSLDVETDDATSASKGCKESTTHGIKLSGEKKAGFQTCLKGLERMGLGFYGV